jgi:hypothetical protein
MELNSLTSSARDADLARKFRELEFDVSKFCDDAAIATAHRACCQSLKIRTGVAPTQGKTTPQVHATGFSGTGSAGTSGTVERRDCLASCRAFLAASFCFFA